MQKIMFTMGLALGCAAHLCAQAPLQQCAGSLAPAELDRQVDALIAQMTPEERVSQLQDRAVAIPRLGIPAYNWWNEGLHGIARNGHATVFPQAIGLAATFDPALLQQVGEAVGTEARAKFNPHRDADSARYAGLTIWSPNINIFRDPRWGRGQETYGEDPFLTATLASGFVRGIQGPEGFYLRADATPKHFAAHSGPESVRDGFNAKVSQHDLADTYLAAFQAVTRQAQPTAIMCSYNAINGTPACANPPLLADRVRGQWGFKGYYVSDCDAIGEISDYLHAQPDNTHGAAAALKAGVDLDCGSTYQHLKEALAQKLVTEAEVDRSLHRLLLARLRLGMLQPAGCSPYEAVQPSALASPQNQALALKAAQESMVLLKNDGLLPYDFAGKKVAVIGPTGDLLEVIEANYHGTAREPETLLDGLRWQLATSKEVRYAQGSALAEGVFAPVARTALRTEAGEEGLQGEYFGNETLTGSPAFARTDQHIDFDFDRAGPVPAAGAELKLPFSARWTGSIAPPAPGAYKLQVDVKRCWDCDRHDSYRLWVDGKLLLDYDGKSEKHPDEVSFEAKDTAPRPIRLELTHQSADEGIRLNWQAPAAAQLAEAVEAARQADVIIATVGLSPDLEGEALSIKIPGFFGGDRETLDLPRPQLELLAALAKLNKPMVLALASGSAVHVEAPAKAALIETWYPGQAGGRALGRILSGAVNPSGRLPVTIYRSVNDLPEFTNYSMARRTYRYFDGPVAYPFGFGLSYSRFQYGKPQLSAVKIQAGEPLRVSATVTNLGPLDGDEVAELYLIPPQGAGLPKLTLQGVSRVSLKVGEARTVEWTLQPRQLSFVDAEGNRAIRSGVYRVFAGGGQPGELKDAGAAFEIAGRRQLEP